MGLITCSTTQASSIVYHVVRLLQSTDYVTVTTTYHHYNIVTDALPLIAIAKHSPLSRELKGCHDLYRTKRALPRVPSLLPLFMFHHP